MRSLLVVARSAATDPSLAQTRLPPLTRRALLAGTGAAVGFGLLGAGGTPRSLAQATPTPSSPRIGIVGAGIAGLNAALTLHDAGFRATVYEAADRIGGRM